MENRKGSGIFLGVIGVATLIVAIIGATFAFFGANAASNETAIGATGAVLKLGYAEDATGLKYNLIPAEDYIALYSAMDEEWFGEDQTKRCKDDNGNEICGIYKFTIGNPSFTTQQGLYGNVKVANTDFVNLYFAIYDETGQQVVAPTNFLDEDKNVDGVIALTELTQQLSPSSQDDANGDGKADSDSFDETDPTTYTKICTYGEQLVPANPEEGTEAEFCTQTNVRDYTMVLWIEETGSDQTLEDSGKIFAGGINFTSASDKTGVTGVISAAKKSE